MRPRFGCSVARVRKVDTAGLVDDQIVACVITLAVVLGRKRLDLFCRYVDRNQLSIDDRILEAAHPAGNEAVFAIEHEAVAVSRILQEGLECSLEVCSQDSVVGDVGEVQVLAIKGWALGKLEPAVNLGDFPGTREILGGRLVRGRKTRQKNQ